MSRRWHVEHGDGREWTRDELTALVRRDRGSGELPKGHEWWFSAVTEEGHPVLFDTWGGWHGVMEGDGLRVVWDE